MDINLVINGLNIGKRLSRYSVTHEVNYTRVVTTLDNVEHPSPGYIRPIVSFSVLPATETEDMELYNALSNLIVDVVYNDKGIDQYRKMRVVTNLSSAFMLQSVDGKRRYRIGEIELRGL